MLPSFLYIEGRSLPVIIKKTPKAKRITLRVCTRGQEKIILTLPRFYSKREVLGFVEQSKPWLAKQIANAPPKFAYTEGMVLPIFGKSYELRHKPSSTFRSWWEEDHLLIHAPCEQFGHYVQKSLQQIANQYLRERTLLFADQLDKPVSRITLKDTRSRWGSCTADGNISYSWRLIFAPEQVANYICAHEVAHLVELNHSDRFWQIVEELCPTYQQYRHWLRQNGKTLFQYGI